MVKSTISVVSVLILAVSVSAFIQEITVYEEEDQKGEAVKFQHQHPNFTSWRFFLARAKSYCATGWFTFFNFENYVVGSTDPWLFGGSETEVCNNSDAFRSSYSARFAGMSDTNTRAVTFYEDRGLGGQEFVVTGPAGAGIPFLVNSLAVTGGAKYTLYEGTNFNGTASCLQAPEGQTVLIQVTLASPLRVGSLLRDCDDLKIDRYL